MRQRFGLPLDGPNLAIRRIGARSGTRVCLKLNAKMTYSPMTLPEMDSAEVIQCQICNLTI
jgi:hypothetical protein